MSKSEPTAPESPESLQDLIAKYPEPLRKLFIRTLMLHAGYQVGTAKSDKEIAALVRKDIEQSL